MGIACGLIGSAITAQGAGSLRTAGFDRDPGWEGHNNRSPVPEVRTVTQDFGYSRTRHCGGERGGEIGGKVSPDGEAAYYAVALKPVSFDRPFSAAGKLAVDVSGGNTLFGFFNARTLNEWRTPNSVAIRINGRGKGFHAHVEYATRLWRAGGDFIAAAELENGRRGARELPGGERVHSWRLEYDPAAAGGRGQVTMTLGTDVVRMPLDPGHKADGATFDRFGILNVIKSADGSGELWLDDLTVNGEIYRFDADPGWEGRGNRRTYRSAMVRPRFDFGYSRTRHAGGKADGEIGGKFYRGDCRYPDRMAAYGDRLGNLDLDHPLHAAGRLVLRRGVTDSTVLIGFYHAEESLRSNPSQASGWPRSFLGAAVEGPSREGFFLYPAYRTIEDAEGSGSGSNRPRIYPDGKSHTWSLDYDPAGAGGNGRITVRLDAQTFTHDLAPGHRQGRTRLNRFGFVTTWIDGNGEEIFLDDLEYTAAQ